MIKQVIVVRKDLNMRKGKMCAQTAHASMKVFFDRMERVSGFRSPLLLKGYQTWSIHSFTPEMEKWKDGSFAKIVVGCDSEQELFDLQKQADEAGIVNAIILDNGMTEFKQDCPDCGGKGIEIISMDLTMNGFIPNGYKCSKCNGTGKINKPTYTCLAIGPDESDKIDKITKDLKLL